MPTIIFHQPAAILATWVPARLADLRTQCEAMDEDHPVACALEMIAKMRTEHPSSLTRQQSYVARTAVE
jgi:hypothetical protein